MRIEQTESALAAQIADVNYQSAQRTAAIIENTNNRTQAILDKLCDTQINDLQRQLAVCQETNIINQQTANIIAALSGIDNTNATAIMAAINSNCGKKTTT